MGDSVFDYTWLMRNQMCWNKNGSSSKFRKYVWDSTSYSLVPITDVNLHESSSAVALLPAFLTKSFGPGYKPFP